MNIHVPDTLRKQEVFLSEFFEGMVFKLHVNAFKDETTDKDIPILINRLMEELQEFKDELTLDGRASENALEETFDMGNFIYLLYAFLRRKGVMDAREQFIRDYFTIDTETGRVFASRNRSGSRYRAGDEVEGTYRKGRCYIRVQHALSGASVSFPRDHIVFWADRGRWPAEELRHIDGNPRNDAAANLTEVENQSTRKYPFVSQWTPKGKEEHAHYGKWCYQRRHRGVLVRVGYWDTDADAAREGLAAWKERVREMQSV